MRRLDLNVVIFFSYILLFIFQQHLIYPFQNHFINLGVLTGSLIFLPHGIRVLAVMIGGWHIFPGLFVAHLMTAVYHLESVNEWETIIRALLTMIAIYTPYLILGSQKISLQSIIIFSLISSILNSGLQTFYLQYSLLNLNPYVLLTYLIGDILGAFILFYIFRYFKYLIQTYRKL
jgi:hypothetical protein